MFKKIALVFAVFFTGTMSANQIVKLKVDDIHCNGCLMAISQHLKKIDGVEKVSGDVKSKIITVTMKDKANITDKVFKQKVKDAGYTVSEIKRLKSKSKA
jgi:copper chaperone CopZ